MLRRLGIETRFQLFVIVCVVSLIAVTTLGGSGGAPWVFLTYRTLLVAVAVLGAIGSRHSEDAIHPAFIGATVVLFALMLVSLLRIPGGHFDALYLWYKYALFGATFLSLANYARSLTERWKTTVIGAIVAVNLAHLLRSLALQRGTLMGFSNNANYFGTFLLIGFGCCLAAAAFGTVPSWRAAAAGSGALILFGILRTSSRGAALAAGAVLVIAAVRSRGRVPRQAWLAIGLGATLAAAVASPYMVRKFSDRGEIDPYNYARKEIWINAIRVIERSPLLGVGFGQFINVSKQYTMPVDGTVARYMKRALMAHNEYLQHMAELGIPTALLLFTLLGTPVYLVVRRSYAAEAGRWRSEAAILAAMGVGAHALVDNCWTIPVTASGLVLLALADPLPLTKRRARRSWTIPQLSFAAAAIAGIYVISIGIPGLALFYNDRGHQAYNRDDFETAKRYHLLGLRLAPHQPQFLDNLGMVYLQEFTETHRPGLQDSARQYFRLAMEANPQWLDPYIHMEGALFRSMTGAAADLELYRDIVQVDEKLLQLDPFLPFQRKNLAAACYNLGQVDRAFAELRKAIDYEPNYVPGYLQMAAWYDERGNPAESRRYTAAAIDIVSRYRTFKPTEPYEAILLGRPEQSLAAMAGAKP